MLLKTASPFCNPKANIEQLESWSDKLFEIERLEDLFIE